jgi:hypothetical protein
MALVPVHGFLFEPEFQLEKVLTWSIKVDP